jgi:uncharacterized protein YecT (DUF1311 family)
MRFAALYLTLFGFVMFRANIAVHAQDNDPCLDKQTQSEMSACETERYQKADAELNRVFQQLLAKHAARKRFTQKLRLAEEAWIKFRDAHIESLYSEENTLYAYGSVFPMCKAIQLTSLTATRTQFLKNMLSPVEGDVCGFSTGSLSSGKDKATPEQSLLSAPRQSRVGCRLASPASK